MKKYLITLLIALISSASFAEFITPEKRIAQSTEKCYDLVARDLSIVLAFIVHESASNSYEEQEVMRNRDLFVERKRTFKTTLTACKEELDMGVERDLCHAEVFNAELKRFLKKYKITEDLMDDVSECAYLRLSLVPANDID